jgi:hypothetical protein
MMAILTFLMMVVIIVCALWIWITWVLLAWHNHKNGN